MVESAEHSELFDNISSSCLSLRASLHLQLSSFQRMLRVARRPRMEEIIVDLALLQPLRQQYEEALAALKNTVRTQ